MSQLEAGWKFWPTLLRLSPGFPHPPAHLPSTHTHHLAARRICLLFPLPCAPGPSYGWATSARQSLKQPRGLPACPSWLEKARPWGKGSHKADGLQGPGGRGDSISKTLLRRTRKQDQFYNLWGPAHNKWNVEPLVQNLPRISRQQNLLAVSRQQENTGPF